MRKELIILSDNFGTSFSGGCTATANFVSYWRDSFSTIHVVCKQTDGHLKDEILVWEYHNQESLNKILSELALKPVIGYGDFHTAVDFIDHNIPFYFTYHDNYPEIKNFDRLNLEADQMMSDYVKIFTNAEFVFSVSNQKLGFIKTYTNKCNVVRNGISQPVTKTEKLEVDGYGILSVLMAGNITERKYGFAIDLFELIDKNEETNVRIDIFGGCHDSIIWNKLRKYDFVKVNAFRDVISYDGYHLYLNTSTIENLSLAVVDSLRNNTPVLAFNVGGLSEVVNEDNGILVDPYNIEEMFSALCEMRHCISQYRFDSSKLDDFNWEKSAKSMLNIMTSNAWV